MKENKGTILAEMLLEKNGANLVDKTSQMPNPTNTMSQSVDWLWPKPRMLGVAKRRRLLLSQKRRALNKLGQFDNQMFKR